MTSTNVLLLGAKEFRKALHDGQVDLADLRKTHLAAARIVMQYAKPKTPKLTGALAGSHRVTSSPTTGIVEAGNVTDVPYARIIHYGSKERNIKAQPWLSHAAQATEPRWFKLYVDEIDRILEYCATKPGAG